MGAVAFVAVMFYLVHYNDEDIVKSTWRTVSLTISIFCSVLLYGQIRGLVEDTMEFTSERDLSHGEVSMICVPLYIALYLILQVVLWLLHGHGKHIMHGVSEIFAHIAAFAAMFGFDSLIQVGPIGGSPHMAVVILATAGVVQAFLAITADRLRFHYVMSDGIVTKGEEHWMEVVEEAEDDVFSLSLSFLLSVACRGYIVGHVEVHNPHHEPHGHSPAQVWGLFASAMGLLGLALGATWAELTLDDKGPRVQRVLKLAKSICMFASCWCLIFWADWLLYDIMDFKGTRIQACLMMALTLTFIAVVEIFVIDGVADRLEEGRAQRSLRYSIVSLGVLVGFTWEKAFDIAMEDIAHSGKHLQLSLPPTAVLHILAFSLCAIVIPAWYFYILPKTIELEKEEKKEEELSERQRLAHQKAEPGTKWPLK